MNVEPYALTLAHPLTTAAGTIEEREGFVVTVAHRGERGVGEATPLPGWTESRDDCEAALRTARRTAERADVMTALDELSETPAARHALSLAVLDARSRATGVPLYRHLGGTSAVSGVPVNATVGDGSPAETATEANDAVGDGFRTLKVKVGARSVAADVDRLEAVRAAVGGEVDLRADANAAWTPAQAHEAFEAFGELGVEYVEQPLDDDDLSGHAALRGGPVGVALDESLAACGPEAVLAAAAADVLVLKPMALGGPDRARVVARRARERGLDVVVTTTIDAVYARTAAVHLAASLPAVPACGLATASLLAEDLANDPCRVGDGEITVPEGKGNVPAHSASTGA
ncbi:mandelate racemase/muconate lactonizing enzyme family protein [Halomarina ordinaria]|uniref:o-succinylbenzoate synthase n=1 Tax=Halomarina ordinaria TaxID=3033939 RepID=A0ABD5UBA2_9EURY|nr:o-succinylbenzoate synthase [Halomarina sp. PSRA2]